MPEQTDLYSREIRKTGINILNTRIIETEYKGEKRLDIFNSYFEFERLGTYHGYWNSKNAKKIRDYINDWLKRIGEE